MLIQTLARILRRRGGRTIALACTLASATAIQPGLAHAHIGATVFPAVQLTGSLNLNTASATQLELLPGVGPAMAARLIAYRTRHPFKQVSQLRRVKGIGKKTLEKLRPFVAVDGENTLSRVK